MRRPKWPVPWSTWSGPLEGLVVTRYGYAVPCQHIEIMEAAHPVPDQAGLAAAERILDHFKGLTRDNTVLCLISGDGSYLLHLPLEGIKPHRGRCLQLRRCLGHR